MGIQKKDADRKKAGDTPKKTEGQMEGPNVCACDMKKGGGIDGAIEIDEGTTAGRQKKRRKGRPK